MANLTCPSPTEIKPLYGTGNYLFALTKFPEITFFMQSAELPSISLGTAMISSNVHDYPIPGETIDFADLTCTFVVDDQLKNYKALSDWMIGMGFPENHQMYKNLLLNSKNLIDISELSKGFTDGTLTIMDNSNLPLVHATFTDCFPSSLGALRFDTTNSDAPPITCQVTFKYSYWKLTDV
jgi:hypothetical protein